MNDRLGLTEPTGDFTLQNQVNHMFNAPGSLKKGFQVRHPAVSPLHLHLQGLVLWALTPVQLGERGQRRPREV